MKPIKNLQQFRNNRIIGNGQIYVSIAGVDPLDSPAMVFLDYEGTIAVPTPIKTNYNGQPVIDGVAYNTLYVNYDYSLQIVDAVNVELFNPFISESSNDAEGIPDAPVDNNVYSRLNGSWQSNYVFATVPLTISPSNTGQTLVKTSSGSGSTWQVAGTGNLQSFIIIENFTGSDLTLERAAGETFSIASKSGFSSSVEVLAWSTGKLVSSGASWFFIGPEDED